MKKIVAILFVGIFLGTASLAGVTTTEKSVEKEMYNVIEKSVEFSEPRIMESDGYNIVAIDGTKNLMRQGYPILPYKVEIFRFPVGTKIEVEAKNGEVREINIEKKLKPYPMLSLLLTKGVYKIMEGEIYRKKEIYPEEWVDYRYTVGLYNGNRVVTLSIFMYPCRYDIANNKIIYTNKMDLKIKYDLPNENTAGNDAYDFLIIAPCEWTDSLEPLKTHKESHGIKTIIVGLCDIYDGKYFTVQGRDDAEKVKYFIKNAIEQWGIKYVMLVGGRTGGIREEKWAMPVRYTRLDDHSRWETSYLSDLYFSDIYKYEDGNIVFDDWDSNGNGIFAEWWLRGKDILDLAPDVHLGRLACRNEIEVKIMVNKIISYETSNAKNQEWFKRAVVVGGDTFPQAGDPYFEGEESTNKMLEYLDGFEPVKLYTSLGTLGGETDVVREVSKGCGFLLFEGHGNPMSWATHPPYDDETWIGGLIVSDMPKLKNKDMYPICVVGGCHNSQFNVSLLNLLKFDKIYETYYKSEWSPECWSWWLARKINGGSIATIGCTGLGYGYVGDSNNDGIPDCIQGLGGWIDIEFIRVYAEEGKDVLGEAHATAIANYVANFPVMKDIIDCKTVEEWVLLGDPTLKIGGY